MRQKGDAMRVGTGYDAHRLVKGRKLVIGGVTIPYTMGLDGHSDADVLVHAIMDALLGAAGLGDIGQYFPDSDPAYEGISSLVLLERVRELLEEKLLFIENIDAVIIAQEPKMAPHIPEMKKRIGEALLIGEEQIGIKATTVEGMGFTGRKEGFAAQAVCLLDTAGNYGADLMRRGCSGCTGCDNCTATVDR